MLGWVAAVTLATTGCGGGSDGPNVDCDVPELFAQRCAGGSCHSPSATQPLDLVSPGINDRVSNVLAPSCPSSILADPSDPEGSLLYQKVAGTHTCGAPMPLGATPLSDDEIMCVRDWISGLLPPQGPGSDAGQECPDCVCFPIGVTESCYTGHPETLSPGTPCTPGTRACIADNMVTQWGECMGEVYARADDCTTPADEDCDGLPRVCSASWSYGFGSFESDLSTSIRSVAMDSQGNVYFLGDFVGAATFGGDRHFATVAGTPKADIILVKYDRDGNFVWSQQFGDSSNQYAGKVVVDGEDNVVVLMRAYGTVTFPDKVLDGPGEYDVIVAKFAGDGTYQWSRLFGGLNGDRAQRLAVDSNNDVLVTGVFRATADLGKDPYTATGITDVFVVKLSGQSGAGIWDKHLVGTGDDDYGWGIATDSADNVYVTGYFNDRITIGATQHTTSGNKDIFVARFSANGSSNAQDGAWSRRFGGPGDDVPFDLAFDRARNQVVITGHVSGQVDFGGGALSSNGGSSDLFLVKLRASDGAHQLSKLYGDANDQAEVSISDNDNMWNTLALDDAGNIYLAGYLSYEIDFGGATPLRANNDAAPRNDAFIAKLDPSGVEINAARFGLTGTEFALDVAVDGAGTTVAMVGRFFGSSLDFSAFNSGEVKRTGSGSSDGFVVQFQP